MMETLNSVLKLKGAFPQYHPTSANGDSVQDMNEQQIDWYAMQNRNDPNHSLQKVEMPLIEEKGRHLSKRTYSVEKGRLALSKAQEHIRKFEEHVQIGLLRASKETNSIEDLTYLLQEDTSVLYDDDNSSIFDVIIHGANFDDTDLLVQKLVQAQQEENLQNCNRMGGIELGSNVTCSSYDYEQKERPESIFSKRMIKEKHSKSATRTSRNRQGSMTTKRSTIRATENEGPHQFKALPLPDASVVHNNPYALTSAAIGKQNALKRNSHIKFVNGRPSTHRMDAAALLLTKGLVHYASYGENSNLNATKYCSAGPMSTKKIFETQKSLEKMYDSIPNKVESEHEDDEPNSPPTENLQDVVSVQQQLSKLQASLKLKHTKCIHVIEKIHNFDVLNETMDTYTSLDNIEDSRTLEETQNDHPMLYEVSSKSRETDDDRSQTSEASLYTRQRTWLNRIESRRLEAKHRREMDDIAEINNFSISTVIKNTGKSWITAKAAHDRAASKALLKEKEILEDRQSREKLISTKLIQNLGSDDGVSLSRKSIKKTRFRADKASTTGCSQATDYEYTPNIAKTTTFMDTQNDSSGNIANMTDVIIRPNSSHSSSHKHIIHQLNSLIPNESRKSCESPQKHGTTDQIKQLSAVHLSVDEARKVLLQRSLKDRPHSIARRMNVKDSSPYCPSRLTVHSNLTKKAKYSNRFQAAAIQAKLYSDILSKSMHIRQNRLNDFVTFSSVAADGNKDTKTVLNIKSPDVGQTICCISNSSNNKSYDQNNKEEPYQRFELGKSTFFDKSSSNDKGRFRVRDARYFAPDSIRRIAAPWDTRSTLGVMLLVGRKYSSLCDTSNLSVDEQVITVLFDRSQFNEDDACRWWQLNRHHMV